jgi:hypothetical protein
MKILSRKKRIIFTCILILMALLIVEVAAFTIYYILRKEIFPWSKYQLAIRNRSKYGKVLGPKDNQMRNTELQLGGFVEVIHPYLGFVLDPKRTQNVSDFGFFDDINPMIPRTEDTLIVALFGGSFAAGLWRHGRDVLINSLKVTGKNIVVVNLTMGGYKQPQQLLALTYLLSLGAEFDIVINIDGFNEIALPPSENIPKNIFPIYPRAWYFRVAGVTDPQALRQVARLAVLDQRRKNWAQLFAISKLYHSVASCLLWEAVDRLLESKRTGIILALQRGRILSKEYVVTGPQYSFSNDDALYDYLAKAWKRCSFQMRAICDANGIRYYHFLQPNQYVEGSKPMKQEERAVAINDENPYRISVVKGYPFLRRYGHDLIGLGVKFHDLTMTFAGIEDILYGDDCCHLNKQGYKIIATTIGDVFEEDLLPETQTAR